MTEALSDHFAPLAPQYDILLCDVWGVVHNGIAAYRDACDALARFRAKGGSVVLVTNAPRPSYAVEKELRRLDVPKESYDGIVSSGDVTRATILARAGQKVYHLGPERDLPIFDGIDVSFASEKEADFVVCTGMFNDATDTPDDYRATLDVMLSRKLFMACANPDVVVEKGGRLIYCAGALADVYKSRGGDVLYAGKPYAPIYDQALALAAKVRGAATDRSRVMAIGDSVRTDYAGARDNGMDFMFITSGIHADEFGHRDNPDAAAVAALLRKHNATPTLVMSKLRW